MKFTIQYLGQNLVIWITPETPWKLMEINKIFQDNHELTWLLNDDEIAMRIYGLAYDAIEAYKSEPDFEYDERRKA